MIDTTNMSIMANFIQPTTSTTASNMISAKDSDSDSNLTIDEMDVSEDFFSSLDSDANGLASQSELTTAIETAMSQFDGEMPSKEEFQTILSDFGFDVPSNSDSNSLSDSQLDTISSVLEDYDASNLSESDAQEIVAALSDAGIEASGELESALADAGFDAQEIGTLAGVGGPQGPAGGGGGEANSSSSSDEEEDYDIMDTNEDGVVSFAEMQEYYSTSDDYSTENLSADQQNALDNLQVLMETLKSGGTEDVDTDNFESLLKVINNQSNNSEINTYLQNTNSTSVFGYA